MATASRSSTRLARSTPLRIAAAPRCSPIAPRQGFQRPRRRTYADSSKPSTGGSSTLLYSSLAVAAVGGGAGYYLYAGNSSSSSTSTTSTQPTSMTKPSSTSTLTLPDYQAVYNAIAARLVEHDDYDDGSYGPVLLRLAWHCSGTYDAATKTGGSNGATMRFAPEADHGANAGLVAARDFLEPVKVQFPWISYSDLWTLGGVCAIQEMSGPVIPWRPGRNDRDASWVTPDGRLPDGAKEQDHLRAIFGRMGFDDREIVALSGAHALGRCHSDRSGFDGPWTFSPTMLTNDYFKLLVDEQWQWKKWRGNAQYEDKTTKTLMMLPSDMALVKDAKFKPWVEAYAKDNEKFFADFSDVVMRLLELGVPFTSTEDARWRFKSTVEG